MSGHSTRCSPETCPVRDRARQLNAMGIRLAGHDRVVALAGNPNTGKSTLFNRLTGLKQHVGNWPGKTVTRAEGGFEFQGVRYKLVDLPGAYSLLSASADEQVAAEFLHFGKPDCTIVVADATALERNLNLVLQILEITGRTVVAVNLVDEARRKGLEVDAASLARELGVPAVPIVARTGEGVGALLHAVAAVSGSESTAGPRRIEGSPEFQRVLSELLPLVERALPGAASPRWLAIRLLEGDPVIEGALRRGDFDGSAAPGAIVARQGSAEPPSARERGGTPSEPERTPRPEDFPALAAGLRATLGAAFRDEVVQSIYIEAERIAARTVKRGARRGWDPDRAVDRLLTSPITGPPVMLFLLAGVFWLTIVGANYPSEMIGAGLFWVEEQASGAFASWGVPWWITGFLWHGVYRGLAWVVSVMLPPMAIFFPLFTILEDLGYLPRVAFNLDYLLKRAGAHGKQALTMAMGFGCNAAGVIAARVIDSPRERLIAMLTNTFVPCNGRFPTLILLSSILVAAAFPPAVATLVATAGVVASVLVGVAVSLATSWGLSRTVLRGEPSVFTLELPPYRRPDLVRIIYTSFIDRTIFVLARAVKAATPAGGLIWILGNVQASGQSLAQLAGSLLDPLGWWLGLDGVILLAYIVAIPANEIVIPTMLMVYLGTGTMIEGPSGEALRTLLVDGHGWTLLTAVNLMLFCVVHNPCATTILTIWRESGSGRWTILGALLPLALGIVLTFAVAGAVRIAGLA